jgi:hypothetical protein
LRRADFLKTMGNINARPSNRKLTLLTLGRSEWVLYILAAGSWRVHQP